MSFIPLFLILIYNNYWAVKKWLLANYCCIPLLLLAYYWHYWHSTATTGTIGILLILLAYYCYYWQNTDTTGILLLLLAFYCYCWHSKPCETLFRLHSWDIPTERKNLGFLFAIEHGAREVVDVISGGYLPGDHCLDSYIPVTYRTGLLWNPYPSMLGTTDRWPKGFPTTLKQGPQEEALNQVMEMVPAASIGPIQFIPMQSIPVHQSTCSGPPILALGLKTFAHMAESDTLFPSSSLWSLFLPSRTLSAVYRGLLSQPLLWRLGLHTAFSYSSSSLGIIKEEQHQEEIDISLLHALLKTDLTACKTLPKCLHLIYSQNQMSSLHHLQAWLFDLATFGYQFPKLRPHRKFAYLTQGGHLKPSSNPRLNYIDANQRSHNAEPNFDTFFLSFSGKGSGDLFFPKSTFQQGRNALLRIALAHEVSPGYEYFIFTDEDVQLRNVENPIHFWKQDMSSNPWVRIEVVKSIIFQSSRMSPKISLSMRQSILVLVQQPHSGAS